MAPSGSKKRVAAQVIRGSSADNEGPTSKALVAKAAAVNGAEVGDLVILPLPSSAN